MKKSGKSPVVKEPEKKDEAAKDEAAEDEAAEDGADVAAEVKDSLATDSAALMALTDADQQITPDQLAHLVDGLILRQTDSSVADEELRLLREQIDHIDQQALQLLASRFEVAKQIARVKSQGNLAVYQPKRWESLLRRRLQTAQELGMSSDFTKALFEKIHAESVRIQESELHPEEKDKRN